MRKNTPAKIKFPMEVSRELNLKVCSNDRYGAVSKQHQQVPQTFESVDEILKCDHSNESY